MFVASAKSFSLISENAYVFDMPITGGNPIYFSDCLMFFTPERDMIYSLTSVAIFLVKTIEVLSLLICCSDA